MYHELGVRYMTLTHSANTDWADAATDTPEHSGLTPFGEDVVREMNRIGMMVGHLPRSDATMVDRHPGEHRVPVIFSHSSARALADHVATCPTASWR
jgi:membrane dipeptidase